MWYKHDSVAFHHEKVLFAEWGSTYINFMSLDRLQLLINGGLVYYYIIRDDLFCGNHLIMALLSFHIMLFLESVNRELRPFEGTRPLHWWFVGSFD